MWIVSTGEKKEKKCDVQKRNSEISRQMRWCFGLHCLVLCLVLERVIGSIVFALRCQDGVALGCDSYTVSKGSNYVTVRNNLQKIIELTPFTVICSASGGDDDIEFGDLCDDITKEIKYQELLTSNNNLIGAKGIAKYARRLMNEKYRRAHVIIAGKERSNDEFSICEILPGGSLIEEDYAICGVAANYVLPLVRMLFDIGNDNKLKAVPALGDDTIQKVYKVLKQAKEVEHTTGGMVQLWTVSPDGMKKNVIN